MDKILNFIAYIVIIIIAIPITILEAIFKIVSFVTLFIVFLMMMFAAPLFRNFSWPKPIQKLVDYTFSFYFAITSKVINAYKKALYL